MIQAILTSLVVLLTAINSPHMTVPQRDRITRCSQIVAAYTEGNLEVQALLDELLFLFSHEGHSFDEWSDQNPYWVVLDAVEYAAYKHRKQYRKKGKSNPFILHPMRAAVILWDEGNVRDANVLAAAILHDTVSDTDATSRELYDRFGPLVMNIVVEVSNDRTLPKGARRRLQVINAGNKSEGAKLVKLATELDDLRHVPGRWDEARVNDYYQWMVLIVNGLRGTNAPLEMAFDELFEAHRLAQ